VRAMLAFRLRSISSDSMAQVETRSPHAARSAKRDKPPSVLVVLVVKDGARWLRQCLLALSRQTHPRISVLAIDNGSVDGSADMLESALGSSRVIRLPSNAGFSAAVGEGLRSELADQADYALVLHDDSVLAPDAVAGLVEAAQRIQGAGIVGPKIVDWDDPRVLRDIGQSADRFGYPYSPLEEGEIDQGQYDRIREVLFVSSCAMLVSRHTWGRIGPPDERLIRDQEDLDFCWRARVAGFRVLMTPRAVARHRGATLRGERAGPSRAEAQYHRERVALLAILKNYGLLSLLWILPAHLAQGTLRVASLVVARRFEDAFQVLAAWGWNLAHLPGTLRRRVQTQAMRTVPDRSVRRTMAPAWIRVRRLIQAGTQALLPDLGEAPAGGPLAVRARVARLVGAHPVATASAMGLMLAAVAYRHLLGHSPLAGGGISAFPAAPSDFFREFLSGLRHTGLGGMDPASPALGFLGMGSILALGSPALLQKVLLLGLPAAAAVGCYRAVRPHTGATVPAVVAAACYGLSGILLWAVSEGRLPVLVFLAGLPWLAEKVRVAFDRDRHSNPLKWVAGAGLGLAVLVSFFPATVLALGVVLLSCLLVPSGRWMRRRGAAMTAGAVGTAAILALPVTIGLLRSGGLGLTDQAGAPDFLELARLSPGGAPGDWPTGLFLPAAAAAALLFVSGRHGPTAVRAALAATLSVYLAWGSAAGYLPVPLSNPVAYLGVAGLGFAVLVGLGLTVLTSGVASESFGHRQVGAGLIGALLLAGLAAQGFQAARGSWAVGTPERVPAAYSLVAQASSTPYRVLWIGDPGGDAFPAPGGLPDGTVPAGPASVRFAVRGPAGSSALDVGRSPAGSGYSSLREALTEILGGQTRHGGALLGPFAIRYVVAEPADLPPRALRMLLRQFDLDVVPAGGLRIFQNSKAVPLAGQIEDPAWLSAAEKGGQGSVISLDAPRATPLREREDGQVYAGVGARGPALALLSEQFGSGWSLTSNDGGSSPARPAFGWATGFDLPAGQAPYELRFGGQGPRTLLMSLLVLLWVSALWLTRRPVRGG
jgi:GT2 family glycosyltransferase